MATFNYSGIHHVALATSDMDATIRYWRDLLGFKMALSMESDQGKQYSFSVAPGMMVTFFEWTDVKPIGPKRHGEPVDGPFIFDHLAIGLETEEDLYRLQDRLVDADKPVSDVIDHGYIYSFYTYDPNGVPLEFNVRLSGFDFHQEPWLKDPHPTKIARGGPNPADDQRPVEPDIDIDTARIIIRGKDADLFRK